MCTVKECSNVKSQIYIISGQLHYYPNRKFNHIFGVYGVWLYNAIIFEKFGTAPIVTNGTIAQIKLTVLQ